jgi:hypothetical protein
MAELIRWLDRLSFLPGIGAMILNVGIWPALGYALGQAWEWLASRFVAPERAEHQGRNAKIAFVSLGFGIGALVLFLELTEPVSVVVETSLPGSNAASTQRRLTFNDQARQSLILEMKAIEGASVQIAHCTTNECVSYGKQFRDLFATAGWMSHDRYPEPLFDARAGLTIVYKNGDEKALAVLNALRARDIEFTPLPLSDGNVTLRIQVCRNPYENGRS